MNLVYIMGEARSLLSPPPHHYYTTSRRQEQLYIWKESIASSLQVWWDSCRRHYIPVPSCRRRYGTAQSNNPSTTSHRDAWDPRHMETGRQSCLSLPAGPQAAIFCRLHYIFLFSLGLSLPTLLMYTIATHIFGLNSSQNGA